MRCLGLDIGSSSIKGAVLDLETSQVSHIVREPFPDPISGLPPGFHEVDVEEIYTQALNVIDRLCMQAPDATTLLSCGQMGGIMLVDRKLRAVTNYLSWRDQRTTIADASGAAGRVVAGINTLGTIRPGTAAHEGSSRPRLLRRPDP